MVAEAGSAGEAAIQGDENLAKADYVSKSVQTDCLMEVAAGTADAAVLDLTLANAMIGEGTDYASLKIVDELNAEEYGVAFRKGSDAAAAVDAAFDELKEFAAPLGERAEVKLLRGSAPAELILRCAKDEGCDLIVMGSRGRGGVKGYLGSVSYAVVQGSPIAVLITKEEA